MRLPRRYSHSTRDCLGCSGRQQSLLGRRRKPLCKAPRLSMVMHGRICPALPLPALGCAPRVSPRTWLWLWLWLWLCGCVAVCGH